MAQGTEAHPDKKKGEVGIRDAADMERELTDRDLEHETERARRAESEAPPFPPPAEDLDAGN